MTGIVQSLIGSFGSVVSAVTDAYFNLVTLLLPGNGTNGAQNNTFLDSSTNNFTITRNGNTTQGTFSPFSQTGWSNYFDGSSAYLTVADNAAFEMTGDFTVECWVYPTVGSAFQYLVSKGTGADFVPYQVILDNANKPAAYLSTNGTSFAASIVGSTAATINAWNHIALVRSGSAVTLYLNGTSVGTGTVSGSLFDNTRAVGIGAASDGGTKLTGYLSNVRIVKGTAVYTSAFTVPTSPLTAITNTSLLTCQSNRFLDNSSNAFAITVNGTPSVQAFSPFAPTAAYSAATNGGSGYFDGTGDYLSLSASGSPTGTQNFTIEGWIYVPSASTEYAILQNTNGTSGFYLRVNSTGKIQIVQTNVIDIVAGATSVVPNAWNYFCVTRSGNTFNIYLNSTSVDGTTSNSVSFTTGGNTYVGAYYNGAINFSGYMSSLRVVIGTATAPTSIPTAPFTAITNTQLLLNYTNAGITDATAKNDLETVGNAQISTTQSKFGGSSMYFDGTGDYLLIPSSNVNRPLFDFGSGNWTVEFWVNWTTAPSATTEFRLWWSSVRSTGVARLDLYIYNNIVYAGWSGTNVLDSGSLSWNTGQWYHMAFVRSGNSWAAFRDGTRIASATNSTTLVSSPAKIIGENVNAYIDDFRVTTGYARYDPSQTTVTIPTAAFPLQ